MLYHSIKLFKSIKLRINATQKDFMQQRKIIFKIVFECQTATHCWFMW